jgi:hypothetical protein
MTLFLWIAVALAALWLLVRFVFKVMGCFVHVLLLAAVIAIVLAFLH